MTNNYQNKIYIYYFHLLFPYNEHLSLSNTASGSVRKKSKRYWAAHNCTVLEAVLVRILFYFLFIGLVDITEFIKYKKYTIFYSIKIRFNKLSKY